MSNSVSNIIMQSMGLENNSYNEEELLSFEGVEEFENEFEVDYAREEVAMDLALRSVASLESIAEQIEVHCETGGMDEATAAMARIATTAAVSSFEGLVVPMPALEEFTYAGGRLTASQEAIADIKKWLQNLWNGIVKMWNNLMKTIGNWFDKNISNVGRIAKAADAMATKADAAEGTNKEEFVNFGGKHMFEFHNLRDRNPKIVEGCNKFLGGGAIVKKYGAFVDEIGSSSTADSIELIKNLKGAVGTYANSLASLFGAKGGLFNFGEEKKALIPATLIPIDCTMEISTKGKISFNFDPRVDKNADIKVKALTNGKECAESFRFAGELAKAILSSKALVREAGDINKRASKEAQKMIDAAGKDKAANDKKSASKGYSESLSIISDIGKSTSNLVYGLTKVYSDATRATYAHAKASMSNLSK